MRSMLFIDGENVLRRYEVMIRDGRVPREQGIVKGPYGESYHPIQHIEGKFVWTVAALGVIRASSARVHYYTTFSGGNGEIEGFSAEVAKCPAVYVNPTGPGNPFIPTLIPKVFHKTNAGTKTKSVDINICVDAMEYVRQHAMDEMYLVAGDVDYLPLIESVMRAGVRVRVAAFSSGLANRLTYSADSFECLDEKFFAK